MERLALYKRSAASSEAERRELKVDVHTEECVDEKLTWGISNGFNVSLIKVDHLLKDCKQRKSREVKESIFSLGNGKNKPKTWKDFPPFVESPKT